MAEKKKITRKVINAKTQKSEETPKEKEVAKVSKVKIPDSVGTEVSRQGRGSPEAAKVEGEDKPKKGCSFCQSKTEPNYTDTATLRRFTTDRAKIVPRAKSNLCSRHQRSLTRQIKYARHLALLPFIPKV